MSRSDHTQPSFVRILQASVMTILLLAALPARPTTPDAVTNVSLAAGYQGQADVAVDPANPDDLVVVGSDDTGSGPTAWSSANGGASFSATALPLLYDSHTFAEGSEPAVAIDRSGTWFAVYEVHDLNMGNPIDSSLVVARSFDGLVWEALAIVVDNRGIGADPSVETPDIAVDLSPAGCTSYSGRIHLVWVRKSGADRAIYRSYSSSGGTTWVAPSKINGGASGAEELWRPRVVVGPNGTIHTAWLDDVLKTIVVDRSTNGGSSYGADVNAATVTLGCGGGACGNDLGCSGGALHGSTPALAVDTSWTPGRGTVYVGYADEPGIDGLDTFVASSVDGGITWSAPVQVHSVATRHQYGPALAVHPTDGSVQAVWYDRRADSIGPNCETETWHAVSTDGGASWSDETAISTAPSDYSGDARGEGAHTAVAAAAGRVYPVWTDKSGADHEIDLARIAHTGGTHVPGADVTTDTTWSAADGPFYVTGDQTIDPGVTLTIEAGTEVRFATCDDRNTGVDGNRIEIIVEGILDIAGTSGNEVLLASGSPAPAKLDWYGLRFQNTADSSSSTLSYATIRHTYYGMRLSNSSPSVTDTTIETANSYGIEGSARTAVPFSPARVTIDDAGIGVNLSNVSGTWTDVVIQNGSARGGTINGGNLDLRLVGMSVLNNGGGGLITSLSGGTLEVILSEFNGNGAAEAGLTVNSTGPRTLVANDFQGNAGDGLELYNYTSGWPSVPVHFSNFSGNGAMALRMVSSSVPADARRNYWGALGAEMGSYPAPVSGIWDIHDDAALRHVDFRENQPSALANDLDLQSYLAVPTALNDNETVIRGGAVAREGILKVEVSTDGGSSWADATVEGAAFSYTWSPTPGVYTVMSRVTDNLSAVEAVPDSKVVTVSAGPTLSGTMLTSETWTGGPIVLEGDVVVPVGVTLTVDPGTVVHAQYLTDETFGGLDPSRIEIIVQGVMASNGMPGNAVVWDSSRAMSGAAKGDWYGIRYLDTTTDTLSIVQDSDLAHGVNGIKLENAAPDIVDSSISDCSQDGLFGTSGTLAKPLWTLSGNTIQDNDGDGVDVDGSTEVLVDGATISGNGARGLDINASPYIVTVTGATISANGTTGLWVNSGSTGFHLLDSTIDGNGGDGVFVSNGGTDIRLERLNVTNNGLDGVEVSSGTTLTLLKSTITGNQRGLNIGAPRLVGAYNTIAGNTGNLTPGYQGAGIYYTGGSGTPAAIGMSDIDNLVDYEVYMTTARALKARRNYWGATTTTIMNGAGFPADLAEFRDIHEDRSRGVLDYDNWASASVAGSAPGNEAAHITWPGDSATLNVTSVVITGVAYALDGIDRVEVCARQAGDPVCGDGGGETPFGVVTGKEAWTFEWFPGGSGTWFLQARVVDENQVKSVPAETISYTVNLLGPTVTGPLAVSGPIIADQTWSGDIELTGDVIVEAGHTLTLQAGTTVKSRALVDDRLGGEDTSRIELIVRGNLVTQGTGGSPVLLTSTAVTPQRSDWYGLRFESSSDASLNDMDWTTVEAGWHGIEFRDTFSALDEVSSNNNHQYGLYLSASTTAFPASATINGGSFMDNGAIGMFLYTLDGTWALNGVELGDNDSYGLYVYTCNADGPITLDGVNIHDNASYGAYLYNCVRPLNLIGSTIDANAGTGFYASSSQFTNIRANSFTNQTGTALTLGSPAELALSKNSFSGNQANLYVSDSGGATRIVFNEFGPWTDLTKRGVQFAGGAASASRNLHFNNLRQYAMGVADLQLSNSVPAGVNARANYWDPDTTAEMNGNPFPSDISSIEDVEENGAWGRVDWRAHRASQVDLAPAQVCGFTNPVNGDLLTGVAFTLRGAAAADAGILLVEISTDGGSTWNPVTTGAEVWTYDWTPPGSGNYDLTCRVTDTGSMVQALPTTINVDVNAASITTSGTLTGDETWSGVVVLTGDVTVPNGITLTIDEGTVVKATPQSDDQFSGVDTSKIELIIQGTLDLDGTASLPVTFTSDRMLPALPTAGDWYGIRMTDTADSTVTIHDAIIEAAVRGIWGYPGSHHDVIDCIVRDVTEDGIHMEFGTGVRDVADPGIEITGNTVERVGSGRYGVYLYRSGSHASWNDAVHQVSGNTITDVAYGVYSYTGNSDRDEAMNNVVTNASTSGILMYGANSTTYTNRIEITGNQVTGGGGQSLYSYVGRDVFIEGNTVTGGGTGIYVYNVGQGRVVNNNLSGGTSTGIVLSTSGSVMTVHRNTVSGYGLDAFSASGFASLVALYNSFDASAQDALQVSPGAGVPRIHWNNIQGSGTGYDVNLTSATGADLKHNYWDMTNGEIIAEGYPSEISKIYDIDDNSARGRVDYRGVEAGAVTTAVSLESRFVWPFDGDSMSRRTITLEGTAYADAGVQSVEVSTDGGSSWLPATGADFWTFSFTPLVDGAQEFRCRVTDNNSIAETTPDIITVTFDSSLPTTEGTLPGNETWSGPTPILLTGDVIVPVGTTLTIDPGTTLLVQPLADNARGGVDLSRIELIVEGTLDLQGTAMSPVTFSSSRVPTPQAGDWYGIRLTDTADSGVTIHDLVVEYGVRGIWGSPGSHQDVVDCTVRDMTAEGIYMEFGNGARAMADPGMQISGNTVERTGTNNYGIYLYRVGSQASWNDAVHVLADNTTDATGSYGIYAYGGNAQRTEATDNVASNTSNGILVFGSNSTSYTNRVEMTGNQVSSATGQGLYAYIGRSVLVENNTVTGGGSGIYAYNVGTARIVNNQLSGGTLDGIVLSNSGSISDFTVLRNSIANYGRDGIVSSVVKSLTALYNTISNSGGDAIEASTASAAAVPHLHWNNIQGSAGVDTRLNTVVGVDVRRNYWAGTNAEMLAEGYPSEISEIYDIADNVARGRVDYRGVETVAVNTAVSLESRFVWPFDGDTLNGGAITIEGTAYADAGVQLVEISTDGGSSWFPATGADYWTFAFNPTVSGLQEFRCRVTDQNSMVEPAPDVITVDFDLTLPTLEGTLPGNETWTGPGPFVLTGDVVVPAGTTLTIDPGATILVQPLADNRRGGADWSRIELIVEGTLIAQGSGPGSITMTSDSITPAKGHWYGIRYDGVPRPLTELRGLSLAWGVRGLSHSGNVGVPGVDGIEIQQMTQHGIYATAAPPVVGDWTFRNVDISLVDQEGLHLATVAADADILIENTSIQDVGQYALNVSMDAVEDLTIRDSSFETTSTYTSVYVYGPRDTLVERTTIRHPSASGYAFQMSSSHIGDLLTIDDSEITGGSRSVDLYRVTSPTIRNSRITDGTVGVYLAGYLTWTIDAVLENNRISDTSSDGVYIANYADATLHFNDLYNITGYALNNQSPNDIDAADNYWGEDTVTEMGAKGCSGNIDTIYDQRDNGAKGLVTFCAYATGPFGDQPTIYFQPGMGGDEIRWNPKASLTYDLIRGDLSSLAVAGPTVDLGAVTCEAMADSSGVIPDGSPDPAAGQTWFFLLRDHTTPGTYGIDSAGRLRVPASGDCP